VCEGTIVFPPIWCDFSRHSRHYWAGLGVCFERMADQCVVYIQRCLSHQSRRYDFGTRSSPWLSDAPPHVQVAALQSLPMFRALSIWVSWDNCRRNYRPQAAIAISNDALAELSHQSPGPRETVSGFLSRRWGLQPWNNHRTALIQVAAHQASQI
jgi:hypothetical protein